MFHELCITMTMRLVALGHSLSEAQYLAVLIVLQLVLLCAQLGYRVVLPDEIRLAYRTVLVPQCWVPSLGITGVIPVASGSAGGHTRTLLQI